MKLAREEERVNLLRKFRYMNLGTRNVEDFLKELRDSGLNKANSGLGKDKKAGESYPDGNQGKKPYKTK